MYYIIIFYNYTKYEYKYNFIIKHHIILTLTCKMYLKFRLNWDVIPCRSGEVHVTKGLPDSLTTWEVRAVGVFNNGEIRQLLLFAT